MSDLLPFIIAGLTSGAVYGLAGVGLVLTYKTSGVFNFAHGAVAAASAYAFYELHVVQELSWPIAAVLCIVAVGGILGFAFELIARAVSTASLELRVAATIGALLVIQAALVLRYSSQASLQVPVFLPSGDVQIGGTAVQYSDLITFGFAVVCTVALSMYFRVARSGLAMRAAVGDADLLDLSGTSPVRTRRAAWALGTGLAAASGVLFSPILQLDPVLLTLLVVQAFGAAAVGRFTSLPWTFAGGLMIGVLASLSTKWFTSGLLAGLPSALPFVVLFVVLLVFPKRWLVERQRTVVRPRPAWHAPAPLQLGMGLVTLVLLALIPELAPDKITDWTVAVASIVIFLSLGLLVRTSGQVSLGHVGFTAIGAAAFSHLAVGQGVPWFLALVLVALVAVPVGALLAIPSIRLSGLYLALATFGFGVVLQYMFYTESYMFGSTGSGLVEPRPALFESDRAYYYLVLAVAVLVTLLVVALNRSRLGRLLRGLADSPTALATSGTTVDVTRVVVFCLSAALASVGGALVAVAQQTASADQFPPLLSLTYFALIVIVAGREPWYALMAAAAMVLAPAYIQGEDVDAWSQLLFGATAIFVAIAARRLGVPLALQQGVDRVFRRKGPESVADSTVDESGRLKTEPSRVAETILRVEGLQVRFGGLIAVDDLDLVAQTGKITGLIGPNGAGKTTTFNACSGLNRPSAGHVFLDQRDVSRLGPAPRARLGLGRTFQQMQLFESLTVRDNVAIGAEGSLAGANPLWHLLVRRGEARSIKADTDGALELCELTALADVRVSELATGQRRLVELARCLASPARILLLDEPSSGLDHSESKRFGEILKGVVAQRGVGILLVEHDMALVLSTCDDIYVLDFGRLIFHGTSEEVHDSPVVQAAYLGDREVEEAPTVHTEPPATVGS